MKLAFAGKGGVGKTTIAGTASRAWARAGWPVLALDGDVNPMLGVSLGVDLERTETLDTAREALEAGRVDPPASTHELIDALGAQAPDGVRLLLVARMDRADPG